jgi:hypothetical protein
MMKIFFLLFFLPAVFLSGCSTSYNYPSGKITIYKIYEDEKDYALLSVRGDSAIVVLDWSEHDVKPIPFSHAQVMKNDSIAWIARDGKGSGDPTIAGILIGTGIGFILAVLDNGTYLGSGPQGNIFGLEFIGLCTVLGAGISTQFPPSKEMTLSSQKNREFLRQISAYPDKEPDEMHYIK